MTFEGQYLTYAEYQALGGSAIGEMPFNLLEFEARRQIDIRTFDRVKKIKEIPQEVKLCDYALINSIKGYNNSKETAESNDKTSESIDGYSFSKLTPSTIKSIVESHQSEVQDTIRTYLINVEIADERILYPGVDKSGY